jgi:hypothetical protein
MQQTESIWPPRVGDGAYVKESGLRGTVVRSKGVYQARFQLKVAPVGKDGSAPTPGQARAARVASRWYGLDELEPAPSSDE